MLTRGHAVATYGKPNTGQSRIVEVSNSNTLGGTKVHVGSGAPTASLGNTGDMYLDSTTGSWYGPKDPSTAWTGKGPIL